MILVTGGAGFIGSALVKALVGQGYDVRVLDDGSRGRQRRLEGVLYDNYIGDVRDPEFVWEAMRGIDEVWHLAFVNGTKNFYEKPELVLDVGIRGIINVLDACENKFRRANGVKRFFLASSSEVYQTPPVIPTDETVPLSIPDPFNPRYSYAAGKIISEVMTIHAAHHFERAVILRPHNVYGPDMGEDHVIPQIARRVQAEGRVEFQEKAPDAAWTGRRPFWGGFETRAFCYIDDAVEAFLAIRRAGEHRSIYNVGTDEEVAIVDLARKIAARRGVEIEIAGEKPPDGGTIRRCPDISKLRALGFSPRVSLDEGLDRTLEWYWRQEKAA